MIVDNDILVGISGGATSSFSSLLNALTKMITTIMDIGRSIGSAIRYKVSKKSC